MPSSNTKIVKNTFLLYAKTLITMVLSFFTTRMILNALGDSDFGVFGTVAGATAMLASLNLAMTQATQRFMNYAEGENNPQKTISIFNNTIILHICIGIAIAVIMVIMYYPFFNGIFNIPDERTSAAKIIYIFLIISTFITIITVPYDALVNAHEDFLYYSIVGIVVAVLNLVSAIIIVNYASDKLILYGLLNASISVINMIIMRIYCKKKYEECIFEPKKYVSREQIKELGSFAGWNLVGITSSMAGNHGSTILMNHYFGPIAITAKNLGDQICEQVNLLTTNMTKALNPVIMKSEGSGNRQKMLDLTYVSCRFSFMLYLVIAVPFLFNTNALLELWLGQVPQFAVIFCQLQVIRTLFEQLFVPLKTSLIAQGDIKQINIVDLILGVITFCILLILYKIGFTAIWHYYVSIAVMVIIEGCFKLLICKKNCGLDIPYYAKKVIIKSNLVMLACVAVAYGLLRFAYLETGLLATLIIMVTTLAIIITFGLMREERGMIKEIWQHTKLKFTNKH